MLNMKNLVTGLALLLLVAGCGSSTPSVSQARDKAQPYLSKFGEIVDFHKVNAVLAEVKGVKLYKLYFRAAVRMKPGFCWVKNNFTGDGEISNRCRTDRLFRLIVAKATPIPADAIYAIRGNVTFIKTENGWQAKEWESANYGYCIDKSYSDCYTGFWGQENNDL